MSLIKPRTFWLGLTDIAVSLILLVIGTQYPQYLDLTNTLIGVLQPVVVALIISLTGADLLVAWYSFKLQLLQAEGKAK